MAAATPSVPFGPQMPLPLPLPPPWCGHLGPPQPQLAYVPPGHHLPHLPHYSPLPVLPLYAPPGHALPHFASPHGVLHPLAVAPPPFHAAYPPQRELRRPHMGGNVAAIATNKRITAATCAQEIFLIVEQEHALFDTVCLATAMHKLASLRGAPNLHAEIVQAPEFYRLKQLIYARRAELTARNLSNTLWSLAKINHHPGDQFLEGMAGEAAAKARNGNAQNVANLLWAFATLGFHPGDEVLQALAEAAAGKLTEFTSQNMSNTVLAFAKLEFDPGDELLEGLAAQALDKITTFTPQALSNTLWGLSKLGINAPELMEGVGRAARGQLYEYNSQNLANSVWAYANIGVNPGEDLLQDFACVAVAKMPEFSPQHISNLLWAYAKLGAPHPELFAEAGRHATRIMHTFTPQSIANLAWAFATLNECPDQPLVQALLGHAQRLLPDFSPQNLSNTAWALATLKEFDSVRLSHRALLVEVAGEVGRRLLEPKAAADFSRQHLANFVWALATLEFDPGKRTLMCIAEALVTRADLCNPQELSNSVWAYAKLAHYDGQLMHAMAAESLRRLDEFSQQNLSNLAWGYAKLAHVDEQLLGAVAERAASMTGELSLQHCTNILWAYSSLGWSPPGFLPALIDAIKQRLADTPFNVQQLCNSLWSAAVAQQCDHGLWDSVLAQLAALSQQEAPYTELPTEALTQVFQALMLQLAHAPEQPWPLPDELLAPAQEAWVQSALRITVSEFHREVSRTLGALGVEHEVERLTDDRLFSVDIALPGERIAVEVEGPHHYTANTFRPLGDSLARHALLRARGWRVVSVPFYHWGGESDEARQALLRRVLREARAAPLPEVHPAQAAATARLAAVQRSWPGGAVGSASPAAAQPLPRAPPPPGADRPAAPASERGADAAAACAATEAVQQPEPATVGLDAQPPLPPPDSPPPTLPPQLSPPADGAQADSQARKQPAAAQPQQPAPAQTASQPAAGGEPDGELDDAGKQPPPAGQAAPQLPRQTAAEAPGRPAATDTGPAAQAPGNKAAAADTAVPGSAESPPAKLPEGP